MRNCAGSASLISPTCSPVAAIVAGGLPLLLSDFAFSSWLRRLVPLAFGPGRLHGSFKSGDQRRALHAQLVLVVQGKFAQDPFALGRKRQQDLAPVLVCRDAAGRNRPPPAG